MARKLCQIFVCGALTGAEDHYSFASSGDFAVFFQLLEHAPNHFARATQPLRDLQFHDLYLLLFEGSEDPGQHTPEPLEAETLARALYPLSSSLNAFNPVMSARETGRSESYTLNEEAPDGTVSHNLSPVIRSERGARCVATVEVLARSPPGFDH